MAKTNYRDYVLDILAPFGDITCRAMFGGYSLYRNGIIFAIIADDMLYFKVDDSNRPDFEEKASEPFTYEVKSKRVSMSYWQVPLEVMEDETQLIAWVEKAYEVGRKSVKLKKNPDIINVRKKAL